MFIRKLQGNKLCKNDENAKEMLDVGDSSSTVAVSKQNRCLVSRLDELNEYR